MNASARKAILTSGTASSLPPGAVAIGSLHDRQWARIGWPAAASLTPATAKDWELAFLDEAEFLADTVGFGPAQIHTVMEKRAGLCLQILAGYADELGESAGRIAAWIRPQGGAWERNADKCFSLQREAFFTGRFLLGGHEDLSQLIHWRMGQASLERELAAHRSCPPAWAPVFAAMDPGPVLRQLAQEAAQLGQPAYTLAPPIDEMLRIVYTRGSPAIAERISRNELMAEPWAGAYLIPLTGPEIAALHPFEAFLIYATVDVYQRSSLLLSRDQREKEIDSRLAAGGLSARNYFEAIAHLRLTFLAYLDGHRIEAAASRPGASRLDAAFAAESEALARTESLIWGEPAADRYRERIADLRLEAEVLAGFADRSGAGETSGLMARFGKTLTSLEPI